MDVLVNQLGYETEGPKQAIVETESGRDPAGFRVVDAESGAVVHEGEPTHEGHVDDWKDWAFWTLDFDDLTAEGSFYVAVDVEGRDEPCRSRRFEVGENVTQEQLLSELLFFVKSQRASGRYDEADRTVPFVGDREGTVDVHGGWYDASGDMSKYLSHLSYANYLNPQQTPVVVWGLLDAYDRLRSYDHDLGDQLEERLLDEALYGADFLLRMLDDEGYFYMTVFDKWSKEPDQREICAYETDAGHKTADYEAGFRQGGGVAIAALARASRHDGPSEFDGEAYLDGAITAFDHLAERNEAYLDDGTENVIDDYCALLGATELLAATGDDRFREAASERARSLLDRQTADERYDGWFRADDAGERPFFHAAEEGLPILALCRYLAVDPDAAPADDVAAAIERYWSFETTITDEVTNPFGYPRQYVKAVDEDEPRASFFVPHENESGYWWQGENARIASLAAAAYRSREYVDDATAERLDAFGRDQVNWILGLNPFDVSMYRGVGPMGPEYHVAYRNAPGGVLNGITAGIEDESDIDFCPDPQGDDHAHRWRWAEQWMPHAAWFFVALSSTERV